MRSIIMFLFLTLACQAGQIEMADGTKLDGEVTKVIPAKVEIEIPGGTVTLPLEKLTPTEQSKALQTRSQAEELADYQALADQQRKYIALLEANAPKASKPSGEAKVSIEELGASVITTSDKYTTVAWKVKIQNGTERTLKLNVYFEFLDASDFQLEKRSEYDVFFRPGETKTVTGQTMLENAVWSRVASHTASTERAR